MQLALELSEIDELIRQGLTAQAAERVQALASRPKIERAHRLPLARLARRAFLPKVGLELLRPLIRPSSKRPQTATAPEKIEYAASLSWVGALPECYALLKEVDHTVYPDASFVTALAHISEWNYSAAMPFLESYIRHPEVLPYWRLVGRVNLLAALVHERLPCQREIEELETASRQQGHSLLLSSVLQFKAEAAVNQQDWASAETFIQEAYAFAEKEGRTDTLFTEKWRAVIQLYQSPHAQNLQRLDQIREKARELGHWETLRDCDFHEVCCTQNMAKAHHLYFGTPFPAYRQRLLKECSWLAATLPDSYQWHLQARPKQRPVRITVIDNLREGLVLQRLFIALSSEFYKPQNLGDLHSKVFPWKHFDPVRSADSLHQALKRLREYFHQAKIPLMIQEKQGDYHLRATANCYLETQLTEVTKPRLYGHQLDPLKARFQRQRFSADEAAEVLTLSRNMVLVYLRKWQELNLVKKMSAGPKTSYQFT